MAIQDVWFSNLKTLIEHEGGGRRGIRAVADLSGLSEEYVYQLLTKKLNSKGIPREIGKEAARKISKAFSAEKKENWFDVLSEASPTQTAQPPQEYQQNKALDLVQQAKPATNSVATLAQITAALSKHFETMDANTRKMAVGLLGQLADDPKDHARIAAMIEFSIHSKHQKLA